MWTLQHSTTTQSLEAWGLSNVALTEKSLSAAELTATLAGDQFATVPFAYLDPVTLRLDSTVVFIGYAMPPPRNQDGGEEHLQLRFVGPWFFLSDGFYTQALYDAVAEETKTSTRVALFASITPGTSWSKQSVGWQIAQIITACNSWHGGSKMQLGSLVGDFSLEPAPLETESLTFEAALRACLTLLPDVAQRWDFSTTPPSVSFIRRGSATARTRAHTLASGSGFKARHEDLLRGVIIVWHYKDLLGNPAASADVAGETSGTAVAQTTITIDDQSEPPQEIPATVETQTVRSISTADATDVTPNTHPTPADEWLHKYAGLGAPSSTYVRVIAPTCNSGGIGACGASPSHYHPTAPTLTLDPAAPENLGKTDFDGCTKWLVDGDIPKWMSRADHLRVGILKCALEWITVDPVNSKPVRHYDPNFQLRMLMTDLGSSSGTDYTNVLAPAQTIGGGGNIIIPPTGIAAAILAARSVLHYAGTWRTMGAECDLALRVGDVLNLTDGLPAWETMAAHIVAVTHKLDTGETEVECGPPEHLGIQDLVSVFQKMRVARWISQAAGGAEV